MFFCFLKGLLPQTPKNEYFGSPLNTTAMKIRCFLLLFCVQFSFAQIYTNHAHLTAQRVSGQWMDGTVVLNDGRILEGQVRGQTFKGNDVQSFRYRKEKGTDAVTYKADDCRQVVYDGLNVVAVPKNLKKPTGKKRFYIALYYGKKLSVYQDPKASSAAGLILNQGEMLSYLAHKDGQLIKISRLNFKKQMKKLLADDAASTQKSKDKKWFKYDNIYEIADLYNQGP